MRVALGLAILAVVVILALVRPAWLAVLGVNVRDLPELAEQIRQDEAKAEQYAEEWDRVGIATRRKDEVAHELIAGRLTLPEAAEHVRRDLAPVLPKLLPHIRREHPEAVEDELLCR